MTSTTRVAIAVPSGDMVHAEFAMRLANMCLNPGASCFIVNARSSLVMVGRNQCVQAVQLAGASHLLFLDSDIVFPTDLISRLLAHDKDIVGGLYVQRAPPHRPVGMTLEGKVEAVPDGLHRMASLPTGCMLIKMGVFSALQQPWFNTRTVGDKIMGEDVYFSENARQAGFDIWCDGTLSRELGHIGAKLYMLSDTK
ncbi:MAG: hypothetical protein JO126_03230 [Alphaproteobacteria bacterium]|nr:hypothetical protein [Alphaproteobacteria bacterium]